MPTIVDQHAVTVGSHVERDVLVSLLGGGTPILVPDIDGLTVLDVRAKTLTETVYVLPHSQMQLDTGEYVGFVVCGTVHTHTEFAYGLRVDGRTRLKLESGEGLSDRLCQHFAALAGECHIPRRAFDYFYAQPTGCQRCRGANLTDLAVTVAILNCGDVVAVARLVSVQQESRVFCRALPVVGSHTNHAFSRTGDVDLECRQIQRVRTFTNRCHRCEHVQAFAVLSNANLIGVTRVQGFHARPGKPVTISELHCCSWIIVMICLKNDLHTDVYRYKWLFSPYEGDYSGDSHRFNATAGEGNRPQLYGNPLLDRACGDTTG